ncbi:MAG: PmeII family type II restriction endonuclease, partial [Bacteroidota bacterium]
MDTATLEKAISDSLGKFHRQRLLAAQKLRALPLVLRKNPYLYRALGHEVAADLMAALLASHLKESDETIFGNTFFEPLALMASGGHQSEAPGVDIVKETDTRILAIAVKSGPNVFNASQKRRQNAEFNALRSRLQKTQKAFDPLLGHGYGRFEAGPNDSKNYRDSSGEVFWGEITGDPDFYLKLIRLMKEEPLKYKEEFDREWAAIINRLTLE